MDADRIALQLYTVREHMARDFAGTLEGLARMGYRAVEFAGYGGMPAGELRGLLDRLELRAMGAHVPYARLDEDLDGALEEAGTLGCEYVVVPSAREPMLGDADGIRRLGETFSRWGEACRSRAMGFAYHNHDFEFGQLDGGTRYDLLAAATDPALVGLEVDVYWVRAGGQDPVELLGRYAGRVSLLHVKDMAGDEGGRDVPAGEGVLPWEAILPAAEAAGAQWYIVEQDNPQDALVDVLTGLRNLKQMPVAGRS